MSKYVTPNAMPPWTVRRGNGMPTHIVARDGFTIIATVNHDYVGHAERLAAAPDLLEALTELLAHAESINSPSDEVWHSVRDLARWAIAKAGDGA